MTIGSVRFLGCTLWTDFELFGAEQHRACSRLAEGMLTDYARIRVSPPFRRLRAADTRLFHARSLRWLESVLAEPFTGSTVVVTHHAPGRPSVHPRFHDDLLSAAFASDISGLIAGWPIDLWIHGHTHTCVDYLLSGVRIVSNQRGYPGELEDEFDPRLVMNVGGEP